MLAPSGCSLPFESRPFECRDLVPNLMGGVTECFFKSEPAGKQGAAWAWRPYQNELEALLEQNQI